MSRAPSKKKSGKLSANPPARLPEALQQCWGVLKKFIENPMLDAFLEPVDWEGFGLMDYPDIIKHPMDLGTIAERLEGGKYTNIGQFESEMRLVWTNCMTYNRPDSDLFLTADKALKTFEKSMSKIKQAQKSGAALQKAKGDNVAASRADRLKLCQLVSELNSEQLGQLVEIIQKECPEALNEEGDDEVEIETNNIDNTTLQQLVAFAENCVQAGGNRAKKAKI